MQRDLLRLYLMPKIFLENYQEGIKVSSNNSLKNVNHVKKQNIINARITNIMAQETKKKCRINNNKQILDFVKKELKPFQAGTNEDGPRLSKSDLKLLEIKHYSNQLKDSREMRMDILSFSTLNQEDLEIFNKFSSKIKLILSDCSEVVFLVILY